MAVTKISTDGVKDDAVTRAKIVDGAINGAKCENQSIGAEKLTAGTIVDNNLSASANVAGSKLADNSVSLAKLEHGDSNNDGKFLRANNGADPSFESLPASGVSVSNNADNRVVTGDGTNLNAEANLNYNGTQLSQKGGDTILDHTNNGYGGLRIVDDSGGEYTVNYIAGRNSGATAHVFKVNGRVQNQSPWANSGSDTECARISQQGLAFGGDTAEANCLDDYEEGTWNPVVGGWDTFTPYSGSSYYYGWYIKVGKLIHVGWKIYYQHLTTASSSNPHIRITGLPYNSNTTSAGPVGHVRFDIPEFGNTGYPVVYLAGNSDILYMYKHINNANNITAINATSNYSNNWTMGTATYWTV